MCVARGATNLIHQMAHHLVNDLSEGCLHALYSLDKRVQIADRSHCGVMHYLVEKAL
jgi:hypothetical protein